MQFSNMIIAIYNNVWIFLHILAKTCYILSPQPNSIECVILPQCTFNLHFPNDQWSCVPFYIFLDHLVIFLGKLFEDFCPFSIELTAFFLGISRSILDKNPWSGICVTNISFYTGGFFPYSLKGVLCWDKSLNCNKVHFFLFSFFFFAFTGLFFFCIIFKNLC